MDKMALEVLGAAHRSWLKMASLRKRRERYKSYTYGRQWDDLILDSDGNAVSEGELASRNGRTPLTNNLIRQMVKCVVGRYRDQRSQREKDSRLSDIYRANQLDELDCRALEEFLISGCAIQRVVNERRPHGKGVWVDNVNPRRFFVNALSDIRGWDTELTGMLHDMSLTEVVMRFSHGNRDKAARIKGIYRGHAVADPGDGFFTAAEGRCRVIEAWTLESRELIECHDPERGSLERYSPGVADDMEAENRCREKSGRHLLKWRMRISTVWHCRYLSPRGDLLAEGYSAWHPFSIKLYPLTDGEIHSFVEDIIDQQKYVNRLITLIDHVMGTSAKGALLFPYRQKLDTMSWEDIGRQWASCDGIIPYDPRSGEPTPQQLVSAGGDAGAYNLLNLEMKLFQEISGVSEALTGSGTAGALGSSMYDSQVRNATIALADLLETFEGFICSRDATLKKYCHLTNKHLAGQP